jgi:SNF2 family DNA or RNA helicase
MPLVFLPIVENLLLWGDDAQRAGLAELGTRHVAPLVTPEGVRDVEGLKLPLLHGAASLAGISAEALAELPPSVAIWALASKLGLELVARERVVPKLARRQGRMEARWAAALSASEDSGRVAALARSMPPAAHAVPVGSDAKAGEVWAPDALLRAYLDALVDTLLRSSRGMPEPSGPRKLGKPRAKAGNSGEGLRPWAERFEAALTSAEPTFRAEGFAERSVVAELERWSEPALGARDRLRVCFRLELPEGRSEEFTLRFLLQSPDDPSLIVPAADVWSGKSKKVQQLGRAFRDPIDSLLEALGRAARLFPPLQRALQTGKPESLALDPQLAWSFLGEGAALLGEAGFGVIVPGELTRGGQRRLRLQLRVAGKSSKVAGAVKGKSSLALDELLTVDWQAVVGDRSLDLRELSVLAQQKAPLVRYRGAWVAIDPSELTEIQRRLGSGASHMKLGEAVRAALAGETQAGSLSASVAATGAFAELLKRLQQSASAELAPPSTLNATLRPYQARGLSWLSQMGALGLGACLADDMGLGKTIQLIALLLHLQQQSPRDARPALLVAPTSVLGNWEREVQRFAPSLQVAPHYGGERQRSAESFPPGALVLTSYGLLRRDAHLLGQVDWSVVALDEAQNIKNSASSTARAARALRSERRVALTGTPVENRLAELWSISEFLNPGLLGPLESFRRELVVPIERHSNALATERLRRIVGPFVLRRLKSDKSIIADLPDKHEMTVACSLTREQATLYKAVVDEELRRIASSDGMERRGRVLALLTFTKQICNHPAQYLSEAGPLEGRSGKLTRLTEMLEEAMAAGDKALIFTQFREMGERLWSHLTAELGVEVLLLHGGTAKARRDEMVQRFQEEPRGPRVFVLSVKAGGTGLNLTAASHVFHYDRWWNPAVEDQATDRAYRIGQKRSVQVHKLMCAGTVEERVASLLEQKRELAARVVGSGEQWITELGQSELRELFSLSKSAVVLDGEQREAS